MNLAILQPVADERSRRCPYRDDVATLGAALCARHHAVTLAVVQDCNEPALASLMAAVRPELVLIYVDSLAADLAFRIAGVLDQVHGAPLIAFGPHASLCPDDCLSMRGAEAVAVGPADLSIPRYLALRSGLDHLRAAGLWIKGETGVMRNPAGPAPESLAGEPPPARDLYPFEQVMDPAGFIQVRAARGGEGAPATAPGTPPPTTGWPATTSWPILHRPVEAVLSEMAAAADAHIDLAGFRVGNPRWTARADWLTRFAEVYARQVALPLRTTLYAPDVTTDAAALLARAGCEEVRVPIGSGSALIRNDMLGLNFPDAAAETAFEALRSAHVTSVACVEIGRRTKRGPAWTRPWSSSGACGPTASRPGSIFRPPAPPPARRPGKTAGWCPTRRRPTWPAGPRWPCRAWKAKNSSRPARHSPTPSSAE